MPRNARIDRLRGVAVLAVVQQHLGAPFAAYIARTTGLTISNGYYGVVMFFAISGFLITRNCLSRWKDLPSIDLREFYWMRAARILPLLLATITLLISLNYAGITPFVAVPNVWRAAWAALTFSYNSYYVVHIVPTMEAWAPLWSLSIEEQFYIGYAVLCRLSLRRYAMLAILVPLLITGPLARLDFTHLYLIQGCADALSAGCLAAIASQGVAGATDRWRYALRWIGGGVMATTFGYASVNDNYVLGPSLIAAGAALFLFSVDADAAAPSRLWWRPIEIAGVASYEIYVLHVPVIVWLRNHVTDPGSITLWVAAGVAPIGWALNRAFTEPVNTYLRSRSPFRKRLTTAADKKVASRTAEWQRRE